MHKTHILLILFAFLLASTISQAQNTTFLGKPASPENNSPDSNRRLPLTQWDETNQKIRDNFAPMNTFPIYSNSNLEINLGPAQVQFIFPFF